MKLTRNVLLFFLAAVMLACSAACGMVESLDPKDAVTDAIVEMYKDSYGDSVEEVNITKIKIYSKNEIAADEALADYEIGENDIVFDVVYDVKVSEGFEDIDMLTAGTGVVDGQWVRDKSNCGILRNTAPGKYSIDAFGTGF